MQVYVPREKGIAECGDNGFYDNINVDEIYLGIENYDELFGAAMDNPEQLFDNEEMDGLFGPNMSGSDCQGAYLAEVVSCCFSYLLLFCKLSGKVICMLSYLYPSCVSHQILQLRSCLHSAWQAYKISGHE